MAFCLHFAVQTLHFGSALGTLDTAALGTTGAALATIASHGNLSATGGGSSARLVISGDNTGLIGGIAITSGLVYFPDQDAAGSNELTFSGGGGLLHAGAETLTLNNDVSIEASGATMRAWGGTRVLELTGTLAGSGDINKTDGGRLTVSGNASGYTGTLNLLDGNATIDTPTGNFGGDVVVSTGTLTIWDNNTPGTVTLEAGAVDAEQSFAGTAVVNGGLFSIVGPLRQ